MENSPLIRSYYHGNIRKIKQEDGLVACACWNKHTTLRFRRCGFLTIIFSTLLILSLFLPYIIAMARKAMPAFLPFISQAGGSPPMNGLFSITMTIMAFIGFIIFPILYITIIHRNTDGLKKVRIANNLALPCILGACVGCVIVVVNPEGFTEVPSKFEWIVTVLFAHGLGACMVLIGSVVYQFFLTWIWFHLPDATKLSKYLKLALSIGYVLLFIMTLKPMPDFLWEELGPEPFNIPLLKNSTYDLPLVFSVSYKISAFCEWAVCFLGAMNVYFLYKEFQRISVRIVLRHKSCFSETVDTLPSIKLKTLS